MQLTLFILGSTFQVIDKILEIENYRQSLKKWIRNFKSNSRQQQQQQVFLEQEEKIQQVDKNSSLTNEEEQLKQSFQKYLKTIKPVIGYFVALTQNLQSNQYGFYSQTLQKQQIRKLKQIFQPLNKFIILSKQEINFQIKRLEKQQIDQLIKKRQTINIMDLKNLPKNDQINYWSQTIPIQKFTIKGTITKGKGLGKQTLGMPTANVQITKQQNQSLASYPNGIYITTITLQNKPQIYIGASSLGTNPHYQNSSSYRILQTYILHDFGEQSLYGQTILTQFHQLIRLQFKFNDFSSFLNGMRNDIEIANRWSKDMKGKQQLFCS